MYTFLVLLRNVGFDGTIYPELHFGPPSLIEPGKTILSVLVCWLSTKVSKALFNSELVGSQLTRFSEFLEG